MKIVTSPSHSTLGSLGLDHDAGLADSVPDRNRRGSMLAWHLNHWVLARAGGTGGRAWMGNAIGLNGHPLAEFRQRLGRFEEALDDGDTGGTTVSGWEFLLTAGLWRSSIEVTRITLVHAGFEEECRRLAGQIDLPLRLAEPLLRSWLASLYRCSTACQVILVSLHDDETNPDPADWSEREAQAEDLAESELNAADPLPRGNWRLQKGSWQVVATDEDFAIADALRRAGHPPQDEDDAALAFGHDRVRRAAPISPRTYRDARNIELRGLERIEREKSRRLAEVKQAKASESSKGSSDGRPSIQVGRYFGHFLKRIFSGKRSS